MQVLLKEKKSILHLTEQSHAQLRTCQKENEILLARLRDQETLLIHSCDKGLVREESEEDATERQLPPIMNDEGY